MGVRRIEEESVGGMRWRKSRATIVNRNGDSRC